MATIGTLNAKLTLQNASFSRGIKHAIAQTATLRATMIQAGHGVRNLAGAILGLAGVGGFTHLIREGFKAGGQLQDLTLRTGTTAVAFEALKRSAEQSGVEVEALATSITRMSVNTVDAAKGLGKSAIGFEILNLNAAELVDLAPEKSFARIADAMKGVANPALRARAAVALFGKAGASLLPVLLEGSKGIEESRKRIVGLGLGITAIDVTRLDAAGDAMSDIGRVVKGLSRQLALSLAPILGALSERFVSFAESGKLASSIVSKGMETAKTLMFGFAQLIDKVTIGFLHMAAAADVASIAARGVASNVASNFKAAQNRGQKLLGGLLYATGNQKLGLSMMSDADASFGATAAKPDTGSDAIRKRIAEIRAEMERINEGGPESAMGRLYGWLERINNQFGDMVLNAARLRSGLKVGEYLLDEGKEKRERLGGGLRTAKELALASPIDRAASGGLAGKTAERQTTLLQTIAVTLGRIEKHNAGMAA